MPLILIYTKRNHVKKRNIWNKKHFLLRYFFRSSFLSFFPPFFFAKRKSFISCRKKKYRTPWENVMPIFCVYHNIVITLYQYNLISIFLSISLEFTQSSSHCPYLVYIIFHIQSHIHSFIHSFSNRERTYEGRGAVVQYSLIPCISHLFLALSLHCLSLW